ncbi:MAG: STAS domain-containing protein [Bryobacteraceae bacterium]
MALAVTARPAGTDATILEFKGLLTTGNQLFEVEQSVATLIREKPANLVFDLAKVESIDSAGVGMLLHCVTTSDRTGGQMRLARPTARVREIFEITYLAQVVPIHDDVASALASF